MKFTVKDPEAGYVTNNLLLPKQFVNVPAIKNALTFLLSSEENIFDPQGAVLGRQRKTLELWDETEHHIIVPREFIPFNDHGHYKFPIHVNRKKFPHVDIDHRITLRPDQRAAFDAMMNNYSTTINLACGKGKTVVSLRVCAELKVPTLVVVNSTALLEQWKESITQFLTVNSVGTIQGTVKDWRGHPIVLAMVQTLATKPEFRSKEFRDYFGLAIYDEAHHMSAPLFSRCADLCEGRRISLTATPDRTDGLEAIYQNHLGKVSHSDLMQSLVPDTVFHKIKWDIPKNDIPLTLDKTGEPNVGRRRAYIGSVTARNQLILRLIDADIAEGRKILALSHSVDHVHRLYDSAVHQKNRGLIIGGGDQSKRMAELRDKNPIYATFHLAREGLDKSSLDTLYILTPFRSKNDLQQAWGRIQRADSNKLSPIVRVIDDVNIGACARACRTMRKVLRAMELPYTNKQEQL